MFGIVDIFMMLIILFQYFTGQFDEGDWGAQRRNWKITCPLRKTLWFCVRIQLNHSKGVAKQFVRSQDEDAQKRTLNLEIEL